VKRSRFKAYPIGFFHLDIAEVHTEEGRIYLFVAVDRTSKFAFAQLHDRATRRIAADFLRALVAAVPYRIHTVLTDNGTQFVDRTPSNEEAEAAADAYWAARPSLAFGSSTHSTTPARSTASSTAPRSPRTRGRMAKSGE
jgi:hypothetical protein